MVLLGSCSKQELPGNLHDRHLKSFSGFQADLGVTVCMMSLFRSHNSVRLLISRRNTTEFLGSLFRFFQSDLKNEMEDGKKES